MVTGTESRGVAIGAGRRHYVAIIVSASDAEQISWRTPPTGGAIGCSEGCTRQRLPAFAFTLAFIDCHETERFSGNLPAIARRHLLAFRLRLKQARLTAGN